MNNTAAFRNILSVSELTAQIKTLLEDNFSFIWISGEISNFRIPASGHFYFSLKDERTQISAVMFRGQNINLKFDLEDGMQINGLGRISLYEPRGTYQIILEYMEPSGIGALQVAFEQLKTKLAQEGLFDNKYKQDFYEFEKVTHSIKGKEDFRSEEDLEDWEFAIKSLEYWTKEYQNIRNDAAVA